MGFRVPNLSAKLVNAAGLIVTPWNSFFQQFTEAPPALQAQTVAASPYTYTASEPGNLFISGGTLSSVTLTRGKTTLNLANARLVPVSIKDIVSVTYTATPAITFISTFGGNP